ncbi:MAG: amidophosphoribosyltransferase [Thiothrix sp.]|nr:MAG: amidophosphoribosyltransferase [Thiothrix sp.]
MCGIIGIVGHSPVNQLLYDGLTVLQHRGQDAAGIMTCDDKQVFLRKDNGLVRDVFRTRHMQRLSGNMGIGHVRYPTAGSSSSAEAQPFYVNSPYGIALGHNGTLNNASALKKELFQQDRRHVNTTSDSEVLLNVLAQELLKQDHLRPRPDDIFNAVSGVHNRCSGAYAVIALIAGYGILGFRDPHGIRPIVYGRRDTPQGAEYIIASETVALDALGFELIADLEPGEAVFITEQGDIYHQQCARNPQLNPCIFEYVYFARPDSVLDKSSVHKVRMRMGVTLAEKVLRDWPDHDIDVVISVPESGRTAAMEMAMRLGVKYREGFIKNRYIGRTFIMPGQQARKKSVRQKLNAIDLEFQGKNVMLVDDSIVRGTTSREIVQMARDAGAKKVYFASAAPPVRYPNVYGIDMPAAEELIAYQRTEKEVGEAIGADCMIYQTLENLINAVKRGNKGIDTFDCSVFDGKYVTDVSPDYLDELGRQRSESAKIISKRQTVGVDLYNNV